jgi:hypothetical protein
VLVNKLVRSSVVLVKRVEVIVVARVDKVLEVVELEVVEVLGRVLVNVVEHCGAEGVIVQLTICVTSKIKEYK